jgi:undecaprenyl-diphosphatase
MLSTAAATIFIRDLTKEYVARLRPNNAANLSDLIRLLHKPTKYSFFSLHASSSFAITTFVVLSLRKFYKHVYLFYLWPLLFVLNRIYVAVHYPSDILVGALVGTSIALLMHSTSKIVLSRIS